jgi:hypothetical protein
VTPEVWIVTWTAVGVLTGQTLWEAGRWVARWIREPLDSSPEAQLRRVARHLDHRRIRGSDSLNPNPARTVRSLHPEGRPRTGTHGTYDIDD